MRQPISLVPYDSDDSVMKAIVEAAKVSATIRDFFSQEYIYPSEFNPSRRDSR